MAQQPEIDIVKAEITRNALLAAAQEMNNTLIRSAYNPLIFDVKDFGVGIMSASGKLWADAPGLPSFTTVLPASVRSGIETIGMENFAEGDVFIVNSPYLNGTHISDTAIYMPVFYEGKIVAFTGNMAHWADIGGMSPGGWTVDSTEIYQEGIRFSHQRLYVAGQPNRDILKLIEENVRVSHVVMGDINAQIATCRTGAERIIELCKRYGSTEVERYMDYVLGRTDEALRAGIAELADGVYEAQVRLDFNGVDPAEIPVVSVQTEISGDRVKVTFDGTSGMSPGPVNTGKEATMAAVAEAMMGLLDPTGSANQSHLDIADIVWPQEPGLLNAEAPAPCDSYGYVLTALTEIMLMSMSAAAPGRTRAGGYQMMAYYVMSTTSSGPDSFVLAEPVQGGYGAYQGADGACLIFTGDGDVSNTPVEVLEMRYPVLCEQFALNTQSNGPGQYRGGFGVNRDIKILHSRALVKTANENTIDLLSKGISAPDGQPNETRLVFPDGRTEVQPQRINDTRVPYGTVLQIRTGGGGGFGSPLLRPTQAVLDDLDDEYLTSTDAEKFYGVIATYNDESHAWQLDEAATQELRAHMSKNLEKKK